jgi:hypothetical protein
MLVNAYTILNYNRCRRFAALNDPFTSLSLNTYQNHNDSVYKDIFLSHIYNPKHEIRKHVNLTIEFQHEITLTETYDFIVNDRDVYCLLPVTATDFLKLKYRDGKHTYQMFTKSNSVYRLRKKPSQNKSFNDKLAKLKSPFEDEGKIVFLYALKYYILNKVYPEKNYRLHFVLLNSDYRYDGIAYTDKLYHLFDFSNIEAINEMVEIALFRMINHLELNDFTPCKLVKKACQKGKGSECKFVNFCYSHLPENTSILNYFNSHYGFNEPVNGTKIHRDTYELLNEGYVSMQDLPISWLESKNHLMQRYCVDNSKLFFHNLKIESGLKLLKYPIFYLDFEAIPRIIPKYAGEGPYTQSIFQYSLHIENKPNDLDSLDKNHYEFIANPWKDERKELLKQLIQRLKPYDSSIVVYNKTFEKTRLEELKHIYPEFNYDIDRIINRLFDLMDIVKMNKPLYSSLDYKDDDLETYNLYHPDLGGSYSLKKVIKLFVPYAYDDLVINDGVKAFKAYDKITNMSETEAKITKENLLHYCRQDTYSMYQIIQGLKTLIE